MPTPYQAKFVKCPFYRNHDQNRIVCEGLSEGNTLSLVFQSSREKSEYMKDVCYGLLTCRDCLIHIMLDTKYEGDSQK